MFQTQTGRYDDWALILGKMIEAAYPERDFTPALPPPVKLFEFVYETQELRATVEVHSLHGGCYYLHIKNRFVVGKPKEGFNQAYFMRRQLIEGKPLWYYSHYWYNALFEAAGERVDELEKDWKGNNAYREVKCPQTLTIGFVPVLFEANPGDAGVFPKDAFPLDP